MKHEPHEYISMADICALEQQSRQTITNWYLDTGLLPYTQPGGKGGKLLILRSDYEAMKRKGEK